MSQITEGKILQTIGIRMKHHVMWDELTKLALNLKGYEGQAVVQIMEEYTDMKNALCLKCGDYAITGGCKNCRWRNEDDRT